jgi:hypothetical protein
MRGMCAKYAQVLERHKKERGTYPAPLIMRFTISSYVHVAGTTQSRCW